jgi:hypothetical protein
MNTIPPRPPENPRFLTAVLDLAMDRHNYCNMSDQEYRKFVIAVTSQVRPMFENLVKNLEIEFKNQKLTGKIDVY